MITDAKLVILGSIVCLVSAISIRALHNPPVLTNQTLRLVDDDGVETLLPSAPGLNFHLGSRDPNAIEGFEIEQGTKAEARHEGPLSFWNVAAHRLDYASGGEGQTVRLHTYSGSGKQKFTWRTQNGFLSTEHDLRNLEFTAYVRVHGITDPKKSAITLKIRGGAHSAKNGDLASCVMMTFQAASTKATTRFGKELVHPLYDYVKLEPKLPVSLIEGQWVGLKLISFGMDGDPTTVVNRLYIDTDPWLSDGHPRNNWQQLSQYRDKEGVSTGRYSKLVDWGGWVTTLRTDGVASLDFAILSAREITPPKNK